MVLGGKFDAERTLQLIDQYHPDSMYVVPTMMARISKLPRRRARPLRRVVVEGRVASRRAVPAVAEGGRGSTGSAPETIWELYAGTEAQAATIITGVEWLAHRGSVGRPLTRRDEGRARRRHRRRRRARSARSSCGPSDAESVRTYRYVGAEARRIDGGWESLGDMGSIDADGYVYLPTARPT